MRRLVVVCVLLTASTAWLYAPVWRYPFVNYDDPGYVSEKPIVQRGLSADGVLWAFRTFDRANWHPLTWISYMLDFELFGLDAGAYHLTSVLLHLVNTVLLLGLLWRLTGELWPSASVAALFALHPLHVESVAWISERKDVLSGLFWFLTLWSYASYARRGGAGRYVATLVLLAVGLMAKPMLVTLPFVFLLLDYWPLGRIPWARPAVASELESSPPSAVQTSLSGLLLEKVPFLILVAASSAVTLAAQRLGGAVVDTPWLDVWTRLENSAVAYVWYLGKGVWPSGLAVLYPHPSLPGQAGLAGWEVARAIALLAAITLLACVGARRRPYFLVGWLWFLGTLVPVIGLVQVGQQAVADRYSYLPLIGPFIAVAWGAAELARSSDRSRSLVATASIAALVAYAIAARHQLGYWRDSEALAARAVQVTRGNYVMHYNLALALAEKGDLEGAIHNYRQAIRHGPERASFHSNLGTALSRKGEAAAAITEYRIAIGLDPEDPAALNNLAWLLATSPEDGQRDAAQALALAESASRLSGGRDANVLDTLAAAQASAGRFEDAARTAEEALRLAMLAEREDQVRAIAARRDEYRRGRPYREPAPTASGENAPPTR